MANPQSCSFIQATICPGYTGQSPLWVNKPLLSPGFLGTGGAFAYNGACYSVPANPLPGTPGTGAYYATAGYMGEKFPNCSACCAAEIHPAYLGFCPSSGGSYTVQVQYGPPNAAYTASASSAGGWLSVLPTSGNLDASGNATLTITAQPITDPPQKGNVTVDVAGCPPLDVLANDSDAAPCDPSTGCSQTYRVGGGPVSFSVGSLGLIQCDGVPPACGTCVANWDGGVSYDPIASTEQGAPVWDFLPPHGLIGYVDWDGVALNIGIVGGNAAASAQVSFTGGSWQLVFSAATYDPSQGTCGTLVAGYVKLCGSDPRGVYVSQNPYVAPQKLYVE